MLTVLFVAHDPNVGGAQQILRDLVVSLPARGIAPLVVFPANGPEVDRCRQAGIRCEITSLSWCMTALDVANSNPASYYSGLPERVERLAKLIAAVEADVVVTNTCVILEGALAAAARGRPHIWCIHELVARAREPREGSSDHAMRIGALSRRVVCVSNAVAARLGDAVPAGAITVIPNGVNLGHYRLPSAGEERPVSRRLVFHSNLLEAKGITDLFAALPTVFDKYPDACLFIAGREVHLPFTRLRESLPLEHRERVHYLGVRDDIPALLVTMDLAVAPSRQESFGMVILEAMAAGLPVVATRCGGPEELVIEGETGLLAPVGEAEKLAGALIEILADSARARAMGLSGRKRAEANFRLEPMVERYAQVLHEVAAGPAPPTAGADLARVWLGLMREAGGQFAATLGALRQEKAQVAAAHQALLARRPVRTYLAAQRLLRRVLGRKEASP